MFTKTTYVLNLEDLHSALNEFLNKDVDQQSGEYISVDTLHGVDVVRDDESGVITAVEFHTEQNE